MAKSPINLLQELSIKQGFMPKYDFVEKRINETSMFICHVSGEQLKACGIGSSKKEAKHNAAKNMLLLLVCYTADKIPDTLSSSSVANVTQSPTEICEMSSLCKPLTVTHNYIGLLQEFYQQQKVSTENIVYTVVGEEGFHLKTFTVEVSVGSLRETATGCNKKIAKQEAAKKLLLRLNPTIVNTNAVNTNVPKTADSNMTLKTVDLNGINPNTANSNVTNTLQDKNKLDICEKIILENNIKKLGTEIIDCDSNKETLAELSEKAKQVSVQPEGENANCTEQLY